jgi:hypothetical protein
MRLPAATQWEIAEEAAEVISRRGMPPAGGASEVLHNDDTGMRVLRLVREASDQRTGVFTSGLVATAQGRQIALYFTDRNTRVNNLPEL